MDEPTLLMIIRRMDEMERRIMAKIDVIDGFRLKVIGGAMVISFVVTTAFQLWRK